MSELSQSAVRNRLLAALPPDAFALLRHSLEPVPLAQSDVIIQAHAPIEHVYFLEAGVTSVVTRTERGRRIEIGLVGRDGFAGVPVLLGADQTPHETFMQVGGSALRMRADALRQALEQSPAVQRLLLRFAQVFHIQTAQTAACNGSHNIGKRLARWLLMCHDRLDGDELPLTHEFIADSDEAVHFLQSEAAQAFRFQAVHGSEVKSSNLVPISGSVMDGGLGVCPGQASNSARWVFRRLSPVRLMR